MKRFGLSALLALSFPMAALADGISTPLLSCQVGGESVALVQRGAATLSLGDFSGTLVDGEKTVDGDRIQYNLSTANGNLFTVTLQGGQVQVWESYVRFGFCDSGTAQVDVRAIEKLLASLKPTRRAYQFAQCESIEDNGRPPLHSRLVIRRGIEPHTAIIEQVPTDDESGDSNIRVLVRSIEEEGAMGSSFTSFIGEGSNVWAALGRHHHATDRLVWRHSNNTGNDSLEVDLGYETQTNPFGKCKMNNVWFLRQLVEDR